MMMRIVLVLLLVLLLVSCKQSAEEPISGAQPMALEAQRLRLNDLTFDSETVGNLKFRGGVRLTSSDKRFGGLSGLHIAADGGDFIALSDSGYRFLGRLVYDDSGNLVGASDTRIEALRGMQGEQLTEKEWHDAESIASAPQGGTVVAFERNNRLWIYPAGGGKPRRVSTPKELDEAPTYGGVKALTLLADNQLFMLTAGLQAPCGVVAWVGGDNSWSKMSYCIEKGFTPTGAATLPGGDILVAERRLPFVAVRLRRVSAADIKPGAQLKAKEIALLENALVFHNVQGTAARKGKGGEALIYLISDDNFVGPQPTAILMFELVK